MHLYMYLMHDENTEFGDEDLSGRLGKLGTELLDRRDAD